MAATQATTGFKTLLYIEPTYGSGTFEKVTEIRTIDGPSRTQSFADATHMESPNGYDEFVPTFKSGGSVTAEMNYLPTDVNQGYLQAAYEDQGKRKFRVVYPSGSRRASFEAFVESLGDTQPFNDVMRRNVTLKITGAVTFEPHP